MSAHVDNKLTLVEITLKELRENEFVAIEIIGENSYDKARHPGLVTNNSPIFALNKNTDEWRLLAAYEDQLFLEVGYPRHAAAIHEYLAKTHTSNYHELNIDEYNSQTEYKLVVGVDYTKETQCTLPKYCFNDKWYFVIDVFSYMSRVPDAQPDQLMSVVVFDGHRLHEIEEEEQRESERILAEQPHHLSVNCEIGRFICAILARDFLVFDYDTNTNVFTLVNADSSRLYLMYKRDAAFVEKMSTDLMNYLVAGSYVSLLYLRTNNTTIEVSATLLELLYSQQHGITERQDARALLHKYNLDRLASTGVLLEREYNKDTDTYMILTYIDIEPNVYVGRKELFIKTFGREPYADFYMFADTDLKTIAIND